jgi:hypothetical protein
MQGVPVHFTYFILYIMVYRGTAYLYFKFISWSTGVRRACTFHIYYSYVPRYGVPAQFIYYSHEPDGRTSKFCIYHDHQAYGVLPANPFYK